MKHALIITTISGFVPQFEMNDVRILQENGYTVHYASDFENPIYNIDQTQLKRDGLILHHIDIRKSPFQITKNTKAFLQLKQMNRSVWYTATIQWVAWWEGLPQKLPEENRMLYTRHMGFIFMRGHRRKTGCSTIRQRGFWQHLPTGSLQSTEKIMREQTAFV